MPLNRLKNPSKDLSFPSSEICIPVIEKIKFDQTYEKAFHQIFGRTILCSSLEEATDISRDFDMNCVTLQGDKINRRSAYKGGFNDMRSSTLKMMIKINQLKETKATLEIELAELTEEISTVDQRITIDGDKLGKLEAELSTSKDKYHVVAYEVRTSQKHLLMNQTMKHEKEQSINQLTHQIDQLERSMDALDNEKGTELSGLSRAEKKELKSLNESITELQEVIFAKGQERAEIQRQKEDLSVQLTTNLLLRKEEFERRLSTEDFEFQMGYDIETVTSNLDRIAETLNETESRKEEIITEMNEKVSSLEGLVQEKNSGVSKLQNQANQIEKTLNKRNLLNQKTEASANKNSTDWFHSNRRRSNQSCCTNGSYRSCEEN